MSSRKRKLKLVLESSPESAGSDEEAGEKSNERRHSKRLHQKRRISSNFRLPSRQQVWDAIPTGTLKEKLKSISPRKTRNDFTKVYNTYNYDDFEDSSDDQMETFISDSDESGSDDSGDEEVNQPSRIKNYHHRIQLQSSSSDEESNSNIIEKDTGKKYSEGLDSKVAHDCNEKEKASAEVSIDAENFEENNADFPHNCFESAGSSSDEDDLVSTKRRRNISVLASDDDDIIDKKNGNIEQSADVNSGDEDEVKLTKHKKNKFVLASDDDEDNTDKEINACSNVQIEDVVQGDIDETAIIKCKGNVSVVDNDDKNNNAGDDNTDESCNTGSKLAPTKTERNVSVLLPDSKIDANKCMGDEEEGTCKSIQTDSVNQDVVTDIIDLSSSSSSDGEEEDDDEDSTEDENEGRAARLKRKSKALFQEFKNAQAKRRLSLETKQCKKTQK